MSVLGVTIFISVALALFFVGGFLYHHDFSGGDTLRDSLLPFQNEKCRPLPQKNRPSKPVPKPTESPSLSNHE